MPASATDKFKFVSPNTGWQLDASGISDASVTSFGLVSATSLPTATGVKVTVDRVDSSGNLTPSKMERINGVLSGTTISSCVRGVGGTAQAHAAGAVVEIVIDSTLWNDVIDGILAFASQAGKLIQSAVDGIRYAADAGGDDTYAVTLDPVPAAYYAGMEVNFKPTTANTGSCTLDVNGLGAKTIKKNVSTDLATGDILAGQMVKVLYDGTNFQMVSTIPASALNAPQGFLQNGKISVTDAAGITVAIKTLAGTDPSATDPVYCRIGDTVRSITSALSVSVADGANTMNLGSAELATKEVDLFAKLGYNATDGVVIAFSRYPGGNQYSDWSTTATNEKYMAVSTRTNAASTDYYEVVGRFAATLSAGAGYTWSVPTYTAINLIQRPIYETRRLTWAPVWTGYSASPTATSIYKVVSDRALIEVEPTAGTSNATGNTMTLPFIPARTRDGVNLQGQAIDNGIRYPVLRGDFTSASNIVNFYTTDDGGGWTSSGGKYVRIMGLSLEI